MRERATRDGGSAVRAALDANRALVQELRAVAEMLAEQERHIQQQMQAVRHGMAMRRAQRAIEELSVPSTQSTSTAQRCEQLPLVASGVDVFAKDPESRYKAVDALPRSYIRPKRSFFSDLGVAGIEPPRKKGRKPRGYHEQLVAQKRDFLALERVDPSEPAPNVDTVFLRRHSHEAFIATPSKVFTPKERRLVREFAEAQLAVADTGASGDDTSVSTRDAQQQQHSLSLETWNRITLRAREPIHRSGFACMLRWELHDKPGLRLCAWTKDEDAALRALASGECDPAIVNHWEEIARRMPVPGRPPVHCLIRYQSKLCASNVNRNFTRDEDALIEQAVGVFGERWNIIADLMDGRLAEQIRHRWQLSLSPLIRRGKFSHIEDRRLLLALYVYHDRATGFRKETAPWTDVSHHVPGRLQPPLRDRFVNTLDSAISFTSWKPQDDAKLLRRVKELGWHCPGLWARVAEVLGNRSDSQVARRYRYLVPGEYQAYCRAKRQDATLPAIYQRPILATARRRKTKSYESRSSYNIHDDLASAVNVKRSSVSSRGATRSSSSTGGSSRSVHTQFKMDEGYDPDAANVQLRPIVTSTKATKCIRPKEWSPQVEEAFRVQQVGWRDLKEYMETYGRPERWDNGFIRCTRVKSNGYYTYWRAHRECDDKYLHSVKLFEYA